MRKAIHWTHNQSQQKNNIVFLSHVFGRHPYRHQRFKLDILKYSVSKMKHAACIIHENKADYTIIICPERERGEGKESTTKIMTTTFTICLFVSEKINSHIQHFH